MRRFILSAFAGLLAAMMATPSSAADLPRPVYKAPAYVAPIFTWTGFYIGINGGYGWGKADLSNAGGNFSSDTQDGWLLGATIGYNLQTGVWVWGIEGDLDYTWIKGNTTNAVGAYEIKDPVVGSLRGRIGYSFDRWLPYITGGLAFGQVKIDGPTGHETDTNVGWTVGAGLEYAFLGAWSAKIEYLYADLGDGNCSASVCGLSTDYEVKANIVRAGLNYRF